MRLALVPGVAVPLRLTRAMLARSSTPFRIGQKLFGSDYTHRLTPEDTHGGPLLTVKRPGTVRLWPAVRRGDPVTA